MRRVQVVQGVCALLHQMAGGQQCEAFCLAQPIEPLVGAVPGVADKEALEFTQRGTAQLGQVLGAVVCRLRTFWPVGDYRKPVMHAGRGCWRDDVGPTRATRRWEWGLGGVSAGWTGFHFVAEPNGLFHTLLSVPWRGFSTVRLLLYTRGYDILRHTQLQVMHWFVMGGPGILFDRQRGAGQKGGHLPRKETMPKARHQVGVRVVWERIVRFHQRIQNGEYPNCSKLAAEFAVSVRTIMRDVDFMKGGLNLPLAFEAIRNGYYYTRPVDHLPAVAMSEAEVFALLVAQKAIAQYHGTPFERPLGMAFRKLTGQLDRNVQFSLGGLEQELSFRPFAPEDADLERFQILTRALKERRELRFLYRNLGAAKERRRQVCPYHVACVDNHWYVFAYDVKRGDMRTFALSRLRSPELTGRRFTIPARFDLNEYLRGSFNVFKGADDYEVVVEFDAWAGDLVRERKWHLSQELTALRGRQVRMRLRLNSIEEAERWVLSWGTHATVIRPDRLRERLEAAGKELLERYGAK